MEVGLQAVRQARTEEAPLVRISAELIGELLIPALALDAGHKMARNYGEQLQRGTKQNQGIQRFDKK